jgi:hypothetical protein
MVGARSPSETGMLPMVPLGNEDEAEVQADPSATAFFALPAPKADRAKVAPPPAAPAFQPPSGGARPASGGPPQFVPPSPGVAPLPSPVAPAQPVQGGIGLGGASAGIGLGGASGTPFQVAGPAPSSNSVDESRMQSTRVYAVIFAAFALVCLAVTVAGGVIYWKVSSSKEPDKGPVAATTPPPLPPPPVEEPEEEVAPPPTGVGRPHATGSGTTRPVSTTPAPPRPSATGNVTATFTGSQIPLKLEVTCDGGFQQRVSLAGGSGTVSGVPSSGSCKMFPKGGVVGTPWAVNGGHSYTCSIEGTTTTCR